jgi:hypothetical protein
MSQGRNLDVPEEFREGNTKTESDFLDVYEG